MACYTLKFILIGITKTLTLSSMPVVKLGMTFVPYQEILKRFVQENGLNYVRLISLIVITWALPQFPLFSSRKIKLKNYSIVVADNEMLAMSYKSV